MLGPGGFDSVTGPIAAVKAFDAPDGRPRSPDRRALVPIERATIALSFARTLGDTVLVTRDVADLGIVGGVRAGVIGTRAASTSRASS